MKLSDLFSRLLRLNVFWFTLLIRYSPSKRVIYTCSYVPSTDYCLSDVLTIKFSNCHALYNDDFKTETRTVYYLLSNIVRRAMDSCKLPPTNKQNTVK